MGVQCRGCRVGHRCGGDQTRGEPAILGAFDDGLESVRIGATEVAPFDGCIDGNDTRAGLFTGDDCRHRSGRIRGLLVGVVDLDQRDVGKSIETQLVFLATLSSQLTFQDARAILEGSDTEATDYFKVKTEARLRELYAPIVQRQMAEVGVS